MRPKAKTLWGLIAGAMATALIVAACGGGDTTPTPQPTATSAPPTAVPTATTRPQPTNTPVPGARPTSIPTPTPVPTSTPPPAGPEPKRGGTFRMRVSGDFAFEWNAYTGRGQFAVVVIQNLLNNLTHLDAASSTIQPDLAESFTVSSDGQTITYKLRQGVTWHDGTPFTAQDAAFSFDRAQNPPSAGAGVFVNRFAAIESVQTPDDETVILTLSRPSASLLIVISAPGFLIYPRHIPDIDLWKESPVGTGPFKFVNVRFGIDADMDAYENYFKKDEAGRQLPFLSSVQHIKIPSQDLAFSSFRTGGLSCACGYSSDILDSQVERIRDELPDTIFGGSWSVNTLYLNSRAPFDDKRVRQAVHIGFDRLALRDIIRGGRAHFPPTYYVPTGLGGVWSIPDDELLDMPGFRDPKQQDFDLAKQLLDDAGIDPSDFRLKFLGSAIQGDLGEATVQLLLNIGFRVDAELRDSADRIDQLLRGDFDLSFTGGGRTFDDAADQIINYTRTGGTLNYGKFSNPKLDQLIDDQEREIDPVKRLDIVLELQMELLDHAMFVPIHTFPIAFAMPSTVKGFVIQRAFVVSNAHRLERVWFDL